MKYKDIEKELLSFFGEEGMCIYAEDKSYFYKFYKYNYDGDCGDSYMRVEKELRIGSEGSNYVVPIENVWNFHSWIEENVMVKNYLNFKEIFMRDKFGELLEDKYLIL